MSETADHPLLNMPERFVLGETDEELTVDTSAQNRATALLLAGQAQRSLLLLSRDLEAPIYNNAPFVEAVSTLARRSRHTDIRILIQDPAPVIKNGHLLVHLCQRLSSAIAVRKSSPADAGRCNQAFLIADGCGVLLRRPADLYTGTVNFNSPRLARELLHEFNAMWEAGNDEPEPRRLTL